MSAPQQWTNSTLGGNANTDGSENGNAISWLIQQTQGDHKSRGAVEYLTKASAQNAKKNGRRNNTGKGGKKAQEDSAVTVKEKAERENAAQPPSEGDAPTQPETKTSGIEVGNLTALADIFPDQTLNAGRGEASKPMPTAAKEAATPDETARGKPSARPEVGRDGRRIRGRKRQDDMAERRRKNQEEALRRHQEEMRTNPEYKQKFLSAQEIQRAMQGAQEDFYQKYSQQETSINPSLGVERLDLPVILELVEQHDVVFICTDTGTGKSTNVPKALLELSLDTKIVSTQPRRTATVALANRVAMMRQENVGEDVGYWIRGDKKGDEQTRLWYMTSYTLLLRILENPSEIPYSHIILDEFHERQPDVEVVVALLRLALMDEGTVFKPKLIIMSATLNTANWEEYFSGLKVATYKQSEPEHPIHDYFLEGVCTLLGYDYSAPTNIMQRPVVEKNLMEKQLYIAENLVLFLEMYSHPSHSILVFLPGRAQVDQMQLSLEHRIHRTADIIPWHSAVDLAKIEAAIKRGPSNRKKIYLATDIAEVSITIPDVVFVVDCNLTKKPQIRKDMPSTIQYPPLVMKWISKDSLAQRRGRVGRVQQGFYFCLFPRDQIEDLPDFSQPPIENSRIDDLSLHCLEVVSNPAAIYSICHGQPLLESITSSMNMLTQLGCILRRDDILDAEVSLPEVCKKSAYWNRLIMGAAQKEINADIVEYECTFLGRLLQLIPVGPQQGLLVFFGFLCGLESLMILAAAVTSSLSPFVVAMQEGNGKKRVPMTRAMENTENVMMGLCCGLRSDVLAVMKAVLLFRIQQAAHGEESSTVQSWAAQKNLSFEKLQAITDLENHIKFELAEFLPFADIVDPEELLQQLEKMASTVVVMINVAFVSQSVEVMTEGLTYNTMESAVGIFSDLFAVPDIHSPSCFRWLEGDIIVPIQLSLSFNKLLASFSTAIKTYKQFWVSLLLLSYQVSYATFSDDDGKFHVFAITYGGRKRTIEVDEAGGFAVLDFRKKLSAICQNLYVTHKYKNEEDGFLVKMMEKNGIRPLVELQREVVNSLVEFFAQLDSYVADEVDHEEDDLDNISMLSFGIN